MRNGVQIEVITRANCPACQRAKDWLKSNDIRFTETQIERDVPREMVLARFPGVRMVPILVLNGQHIPTLDDLKARCALISGRTFTEGDFNGS